MPNEQEIAFPILPNSQIEAIAKRGHSRAVRAGDVLFAEGDRNFCFYVVVEGAVAIVEHSHDDERLVRMHLPGEFTVMSTCFPDDARSSPRARKSMVR